jgi:predicted N-acetyltransferase YhbS
MKYEFFNKDQADEIKSLFQSVFTDSEGSNEGQLIGDLAYNLQATTPVNDIFGFIAKDQDTIVGCIFFTRIQFETNVKAFILSPVAVATDYQKQGVGQKLIRFGIAQLKAKKIELLFTYGDPKYYSKVGFNPISENIIKAPLKLTYPEGWLAQSLTNNPISPIHGKSQCVEALTKQEYW